MSNTNDYIITTLSSGSTEYTNLSNASIQAPFSLGVPTVRTLRLTGVPYASSLGSPSNIFTREVITSSGGGGGGGGSFITPFMYLQFENSASSYVTGISGSQSGYTGSLNTAAADFGGNGFFGYSNVNVFSGSYAFRFPRNFSTHYIDFGTPAERPQWEALFTGSFSMAAWVYLEQTYANRNLYNDNPIFGLGPVSTYGFSFNIDQNSLGAGVVSYYSYGTDNSGVNPNGIFRSWTGATGILNYEGWNHIVFVVSGSSSVTNRRLKAYVNNNDLGFIDDTTAGQYFQKTFTTSKNVFFGNFANNKTNYSLDEVSLWDITLSTGQVNALYNNGTGSYALTALTSSG